ncbi:cutinase family protein [Nocardia transvalensis]|uniref:cutinase family protein n=1 Tax=Nocardia transvalensis TaxID=37333 RepID=UPI001894CC4E|nr:cutinase family protein [Nocardia transvalensis]MBF6333665.1 cutinase family protein [Nocardia transvalensis]
MPAAAVALLLAAGIPLTTAPAWAAPTCAGVDVVAARGTAEPGVLGAEVGDPLFDAIATRAPLSVTAHRVDYPADLLDPWSIPRGTADLVAHLIRQAGACPAQRFVLVGYSQGAVVVQASLGSDATLLVPGLSRLPVDLASGIAAVVLFGDPLQRAGADVPDRFRDRTRHFCAPGDPVCDHVGTDIAAHVGYGSTVAAAADFITRRMTR